MLSRTSVILDLRHGGWPLIALLASLVPVSAAAQDDGSADGGVPDGGAYESDAGAPHHDESAPDASDAGTPSGDEASEQSEDAEGAEDEGEGEGEGDDLFPEDGDLSDLVEHEEDLAIPDVVVRGAAEPVEPRRTGGAVEHLDQAILERFNYDDPNAILQQVPQLYVRQEDGFGLRPNIGLRGVDSERSTRITLMEDGVLFAPAPYAAPAAYFFPLMTRMTGIDVYYGAATLPYGPRLTGGVIDFQSRPIPRELHGGVDLALGTTLYGRGHAWVGTSNDWGGFLVEGVYLHSDGFKHIGDPTREGWQSQTTGFDRGEIVLRGELHGALSRDVYHRLELRLGLNGEVSNETYLGLTDADFRADPYLRYEATRLDRMSWWRTQAQLRHTLEVGNDFVLRTIAYRNDLDRTWNKVNGMGSIPDAAGNQVRRGLFDILYNPVGINGALVGVLRGTSDTQGGAANDYILIGANARRFGATGIQSDATGRFDTGDFHHQIRGGIRLHHDDVDRHHTEDAYAMLAGQLVRQTPESYTTLLNHAEALALSAYLAWAVRWETVTFTPGARTELIWTGFSQDGLGSSQAFRGAVMPGGSLEWAIIPELSVFGGVMRGFSPVAPGQAPEVRPEESVMYEAGARLQHEESRTTAQVTGFVSDYSNFLQQCSFETGCDSAMTDTMSNGGAALVAGFDARVSTELRVDDLRFPLRAAYTYTYTELRSAIGTSANPQFSGGQPGDHLPYVPEHQVSAQAGMEMQVFGINVSGSYVGPMWEHVGNGDEFTPVPQTDPLFLLDATAYVEVLRGIRIYARGENLTLSQTIVSRFPFGARPNRPLIVQLGVQLQL